MACTPPRYVKRWLHDRWNNGAGWKPNDDINFNNNNLLKMIVIQCTKFNRNPIKIDRALEWILQCYVDTVFKNNKHSPPQILGAIKNMNQINNLKQLKQEGARLKAALRSKIKDNHQRKVLGNIKNQPIPKSRITRGRKKRKAKDLGGRRIIKIERYKLKF